ncbi:NUDIX domain-containing protein [Nocardia yunnanensis]|uniref:NUDIX domain-containing protein n=1 Tax=Nocardia yunnanensis TaxID=2382165 RepID=A0A386ZP86_9NOCA|nr:NUDIX domain-containing protein [Nocardia yunnanensis]AYF79602.1 NUDIX domain-containing protein [Nocardia yunnanensis]
MARTDYYDDPNAPKPNSIVVATTAFVLDDQQQLLLIQRSDNGLWAVPGGALEFGESVTECAVRETREETGIGIAIFGLVGIYSDPRHVVAFTDGEVRQQFSICLRGRPIDGEITTSAESRRVQWFPHSVLGELDIHPSMRLRIEHGYADQPDPYLG